MRDERDYWVKSKVAIPIAGLAGGLSGGEWYRVWFQIGDSGGPKVSGSVMWRYRIDRLGALLPTLGIGVAAAIVPLRSAAMDSTIEDPKQWCGAVAQLVGDKATDKLLDVIVAAAGGLTDRASMEQATAALPRLLAREGAFRLQDFLLRRDYGSSFSRIWFLVVFETGPVFIRCDVMKVGTNWTLQGFSFNTNADAAGLP